MDKHKGYKISLLLILIIIILTNVMNGLLMDTIAHFFLGDRTYVNHHIAFYLGFAMLLSPICLIFAPIIGYMIDRYNLVKVTILYNLVMLAIMYGISLIPNISDAVFLLLVNITFAGSLLYTVIGVSLLLKFGKPKWSLYFAVIYVFLGCLTHFSSLINVYIIESCQCYGLAYEYPRLIQLMITGCMVLLVLVYPRVSTSHRSHDFVQSIIRIFALKKFRKAIVSFFLVYLIIGFYSQLSPSSMHISFGQLGISPDDYYGYSKVGLAVSALLAGLLLKTLSHYVVSLMSLLFMGVGAVLSLILVTSVNALWIGTILTHIGFGMLLVSVVYEAFRSVSRKDYGLLAGLMCAVWIIAMTTSNIFSHYLTYPYYSTTFLTQLTAIVILIVLGVLYWMTLRISGRTSNARK